MSELIAEGISVSFPTKQGNKRVLEPLTLKMRKGESVVVVGPSGCGKSTLLNVLAGFQPPDQGAVSFDQRILNGPGGERGVVFQDDALMPWLNALDNVSLGLKIKGLSSKSRRQRAEDMLKLVGLSEFAEQYPRSLSGGQRQRLGLVRALAVEPDFLLLDEPFGALDALTREKMQGLLLELWKLTGKGIFLITHSIDEALLLATDLLVMAGPPGRVIRHLQPDFAKRFINNETPRELRSDPEFDRLRHEINDLLSSPGDSPTPSSAESEEEGAQIHASTNSVQERPNGTR